MPVTRSELLFFSAGVAAGALVHANFPKIKEALGPFVAGAMNSAAGAAAGTGTGSGTLGEKCAEIVRAFAEKIEAVQDAMSEMSQTAATAAAAGAAAASSDAQAASAAGASSPHSRFEGASQTA